MATRNPRRRAPTSAPDGAANKERGEHSLALAGTNYVLRPSHAAIVAIEAQCGASLLTLARDGNAGALGLQELGIIAAELIKAGAAKGDDATAHVGAERIGQLIFEHGMASVTARLTLCLIDAAPGGRSAEGNAKAATA